MRPSVYPSSSALSRLRPYLTMAAVGFVSAVLAVAADRGWSAWQRPPSGTPGRYQMQQFSNVVLRYDTALGTVALCRPGGGGFECPASEEALERRQWLNRRGGGSLPDDWIVVPEPPAQPDPAPRR